MGEQLIGTVWGDFGVGTTILSGCQHTKMRNMIIKRHNTASVLIVQALQRDHAEPIKLPTPTQAAQINYQSKA